MSSADPPERHPVNEPSPPGTPDDEALRWPLRLHDSLAQQLETCLNRAQAQMQMQRWSDALESLDAALVLDPQHPKANELRTLVRARLDRA